MGGVGLPVLLGNWRSRKLRFVLLFIFFYIKRVTPGADECPGMASTMGGPPDLMESLSTGAINFKPYSLQQDYRSVCTDKNTVRYRTADGSCNHVFNLGMASTPFKRMLPPQYGDGVNTPRTKGKRGFPLPAPTDISRSMHYHRDDFDGRTIMLMQWGQFIDHEFALAPVSLPEGRSEFQPYCCLPHVVDTKGICFPILLSCNDTRFLSNCMEFTRTIAAQDSSGNMKVPREQVNSMTAFIDGSPIYGSSKEVQRKVRYRTKKAYLRMNRTNGLLPRSSESECMHAPHHYCFQAGDSRVNEQVGLTALHIVMNKLHNRIAHRLKYFLRERDQETLFQETRRIVIAIIQNIHYGEWLPLVIGDRVMSLYGLHTGRRIAYSGSVDPRILNAFATAAFRFGHSLIPEHYNIGGKNVPLRKVFNCPDLIFEDFFACLEALMKKGHMAQKIDSHIVREVSDHLFEPKDQADGAPSKGLDLIALNIQRGRDHGLPPYNHYRRLCGLSTLDSFYQFGPEVGDKLQSLYDSVDDIDLFTGGMLEAPTEQGCVGATFACIQATQFHAVKFGDRFFFENDRWPEGFTDGQLASIRRVTLAHVLCFFSDKPFFHKLQRRCFVEPSLLNNMVDCEQLRLHFLDWTQWGEPDGTTASYYPPYTYPPTTPNNPFLATYRNPYPQATAYPYPPPYPYPYPYPYTTTPPSPYPYGTEFP